MDLETYILESELDENVWHLVTLNGYRMLLIINRPADHSIFNYRAPAIHVIRLDDTSRWFTEKIKENTFIPISPPSAERPSTENMTIARRFIFHA